MQIGRDGAVNCQEDGVGIIRVRVDTLRAQRPVRCHLARRFGGSGLTHLVAGGPPVLLDVQAYDAQGRIIPRPRLRLFIGDTTVIALRDGMVFGLKKGITRIRIRSSGHEGGQVYIVAAPLPTNDPLKAPHDDARVP